MDQPVTDFDAWERKPRLSPTCGIVGLEPVSHREGVVYTADNQVNIRLKSKLKTHLWAVMKRRDTQNSKKMDEYVWISNNGADIEVFARFPGKGMYSLTIFGRPFKLEALPEDHNDIWIRIDYTIVAEGDICRKPFPKGTKELGPSLDSLDIGFVVLHPDESVLQTENAQTHVILKLPKYDLVPIQAVLDGTENRGLDPSRLVYLERSENVCIIHVVCPGPGEYLLKIHIPKSGTLLHTVASYLIQCNEQRPPPAIFPPESRRLYGPNQRFFEHGVKVLHPASSTIFAANGECKIITRQDHAIERFHRLFDNNGNQIDARHVYEETSGDIVTYHLRVSDPGMFKLRICIREPGTDEWGPFAANFLIVAPKAYSGNLFPEGLSGDCGWNDTERLGFKYLGDKSRITVDGDTLKISVTLLDDITLAAILQSPKKWFYPNVEGNNAEISVPIPAEPGEYSVALWKKKSKDENSYSNVLGFLVIRK